jgi:ubiquinone/menaquinone biosynthesis C-methylase UbiE
MEEFDQFEENYLAKGFRDVDAAASEKMAQCLGCLDSLPSFQRYKDVILKAMNPQSGEVTADLGCGLGFDVLRLARLLGPGGCCIGVDLSATLLASARSVAQDETAAAFVRADIQKLPLGDRSLHSCKVDRTLQHVESPSAVLNEVFRTLRPGGAVACAEPDWSTFTIAHSNRSMVRQIAELWTASFRNPWIGRELGTQLRRAGFVDIKTQPALLMAPSFEPSDKVFDIVQSATRLAQATGSDAPLDWIANATEVDHICPVWSSVTLYVNFARRP